MYSHRLRPQETGEYKYRTFEEATGVVHEQYDEQMKFRSVEGRASDSAAHK